MKAFLPILALLVSLAIPTQAEQFGLFTYTVNGGKITITDYPDDATGHVEIPAEIEGLPVTTISKSAFENCTQITSVTIPEGVKSINRNAFSHCISLTSVKIPGTLVNYGFSHVHTCFDDGCSGEGGPVFSGCTSLITIEVDELNPRYRSSNGVLFWTYLTDLGEKVVLKEYPGGKPGPYTIPDMVDEIAPFAFWNCIRLTSVSFPENLTSIKDHAFAGCTGLTSISLPPNTTSIHSDAFSGCSGLTSILIPASVTAIYSAAFYDCSGLTSIFIPAGVTWIGSAAFGNCTSLTAIEVDPLNQNYSSLDQVLFNKNKTTLIQFPIARSDAYQIPDSVTAIDGGIFDQWQAATIDYRNWGAFSGCTGLTSIAIPESVTTIRPSAFFGCSGLASVSIPDSVRFICEYAFSGCNHLTSISIPSSVTHLWRETFSACSSLTTISIPEGLKYIGERVFYGCTSLTSVTIPKSVASIDSNAFSDCTSLVKAIFLNDAPQFPSNAPESVFANTAPGFNIFYLSCSTGFTSPTWNGYPTVRIDETACPAAPWLVRHGLPYDTNLNQDLNGEGVPLLMAYALDLDPNANLSSSMPTPFIDGDTLTLSFHAAAADITYTAETSTDLQTWVTDGVVISDLDANKHRTASVNLDAPRRFLRLVVSEAPRP